MNTSNNALNLSSVLQIDDVYMFSILIEDAKQKVGNHLVFSGYTERYVCMVIFSINNPYELSTNKSFFIISQHLVPIIYNGIFSSRLQDETKFVGILPRKGFGAILFEFQNGNLRRKGKQRLQVNQNNKPRYYIYHQPLTNCYCTAQLNDQDIVGYQIEYNDEPNKSDQIATQDLLIINYYLLANAIREGFTRYIVARLAQSKGDFFDSELPTENVITNMEYLFDNTTYRIDLTRNTRPNLILEAATIGMRYTRAGITRVGRYQGPFVGTSHKLNIRTPNYQINPKIYALDN